MNQLKALLFLVMAVCGSYKLGAREWLLEAKAAYYHSTDSLFRNIYKDQDGIYGVELTGQICDCFYGFASVNYFSDSGYSIGLQDPTEVRIIPIGVGLKYIYPCLSWTRPYIGLGVLATHLHTHDESEFVIPYVNKWGCGGIAKAGMLFALSRCFFLDIFGDWSYMKINFNDTEGFNVVRTQANLSNVTVGAGVGFRF